MKKSLMLIIGLFIFNLPIANAAYYYVLDNGNYNLCETSMPTCNEVDKDAPGLTVDNSAKEITYNGGFYEFNSDYQDYYYRTTYGQTRMYYYMSGDNFVLCKTKSSCHTYSRNKLENAGAIISNRSQVELSEDEIYYYNSTYESSSSNNSQNNNSDGSNAGTTTGTNNTPATDDVGYCTKLKAPLEFIGNIVLIFKIIIPIIIIIYGSVDFFRAITGAKDDEIKKAARSLLFRVLAGVVVFLLPTIVSFIFTLVSDFANIKGSFKYCQKCVFDVRNCK